MKRKILLPFALSTLAIFLHGCGGESAKINEDPTKGVGGVTENTSCDVKATDCLEFALDYPIAGLNFDCSTDTVNHFATKLDGNVVTGACKVGDEVSFYIQGEDSRKIDLGTVKLKDISAIKLATPPRIRLIDIASAIVGKPPTTVSQSDDTVRVGVALVKIFQSLGLEREDNVIGDIQPTELTQEKKDELANISRDISSVELISGQYQEILEPWLNVGQMSDDEAFTLLKQLINLSGTAMWVAEQPLLLTGGAGTSSAVGLPDGFFGCNKDIYADCISSKQSNLLHLMGDFILLTDRQGYTFGYGRQWRGAATISGGVVQPPIVLTTKEKPKKIRLNAQNQWLNTVSNTINTNQPLRFSSTNNSSDDLVINQGKVMGDSTIVGTEDYYKEFLGLGKSVTIDNSHLGLWKQTIDSQTYKGTIDIYKLNPVSYLSKDIFKTEKNVKLNQNYIFPLYATLNFKFQDTNSPAVDLGIVIDENGDIRTDIKSNSTATDMRGICGTVKSINIDGTITDSNDQTQYRIGTTGGTRFDTSDSSVTVRMMLSNVNLGALDGIYFGTNLGGISNAKINLHNLLSGQSNGINLSNFDNGTVYWENGYARGLFTYITAYDKLTDTVKNQYTPPTDEERAIAKRYLGTVSIRVADQSIPECKSIKTKS